MPARVQLSQAPRHSQQQHPSDTMPPTIKRSWSTQPGCGGRGRWLALQPYNRQPHGQGCRFPVNLSLTPTAIHSGAVSTMARQPAFASATNRSRPRCAYDTLPTAVAPCRRDASELLAGPMPGSVPMSACDAFPAAPRIAGRTAVRGSSRAWNVSRAAPPRSRRRRFSSYPSSHRTRVLLHRRRQPSPRSARAA